MTNQSRTGEPPFRIIFQLNVKLGEFTIDPLRKKNSNLDIKQRYPVYLTLAIPYTLDEPLLLLDRGPVVLIKYLLAPDGLDPGFFLEMFIQGTYLPVGWTSPFGRRTTISGWWLTYPSEKYDFVSWDDEIPNIWKVKKNMFQTTNQIYIYNQHLKQWCFTQNDPQIWRWKMMEGM